MVDNLATQALDADDALDPSQAIALLIICGILYFLPSILGMVRRQPNNVAIFALNLFLGWSIVGWGLALVWALTWPVTAAAQTPPPLPAPAAEPPPAGRSP